VKYSRIEQGLLPAGPIVWGGLGHYRRRLEAFEYVLLESGWFFDPIFPL
jgi:hypothetical protein